MSSSLKPYGKRRLACVFAHPDDESFGPAGTVARYVAAGVEAHLICGTRGEAGTIGRSARYLAASLATIRTAELERAANVIGFRSVRILGYPDGAVGEVEVERGTADVARLLAELCPDAVLTFHPLGISGHPDHRAMTRFTAAAVACLRDRRGWQTALHYYTIPASRARQITFRTMPLVDDRDITVEIDVARYLDLKHRAIQCHRTQLPFYRRLMQLPDGPHRMAREFFTTEGVPAPVAARLTELPFSSPCSSRCGSGS
jgi:LmbE family N-acetylglucosaminyl deacetylase